VSTDVGSWCDQSARRRAVADQARRSLCDAPVTPAYRSALAAALALPGGILSPDPDARWARLVWTCCSAAGGAWPAAVPAAAAVELFMVALDLLDDEEDGEDNPLRVQLGAGPALNVATGLLFLAQHSLLAAHGGRAVRRLLDAGMRACSGQHADLCVPPGRAVGLQDALDVTAAKAAPLVAAVCDLGAGVAGASDEVQERYAHFGWHVGMVAQLANDIMALRPDAVGKTDVLLRWPTLPVVSALLQRGEVSTAAGATGDDQMAPWTSSGVYLTWAVAETYRRHAVALLPGLTDDAGSSAALAGLLDVL